MTSKLGSRQSQVSARARHPFDQKSNDNLQPEPGRHEGHCKQAVLTDKTRIDHTRGGALTMSVEMPEVIQPQEIEYACAIIQRPQDEIMWSVGKVVQDFHKRNQFNDAVVKVANGEVPAHRHVLSSSSEWMHKFIYGSGSGGSDDFKQLTEIRIDQSLDAAAVTQIVNYMYTARCRLNYFNVYSVYQAATYLQMPTVVAACQRLLTVLLSDENLAIMLEIVEKAVENSLYLTFVYNQWVEKFYNQIQLLGFAQWPYERMFRLLSNNDIAVHTEMDVFTAALRWINHDRANRMNHFADLMRIVRWVYLSQEELVQAVELEKLLIKHKDVKQLITDAQWYKTCQEYKHNWTDYKIPPSRILNIGSFSPPANACTYMPPPSLISHQKSRHKLDNDHGCTYRNRSRGPFGMTVKSNRRINFASDSKQ